MLISFFQADDSDLKEFLGTSDQKLMSHRSSRLRPSQQTDRRKSLAQKQAPTGGKTVSTAPPSLPVIGSGLEKKKSKNAEPEDPNSNLDSKGAIAAKRPSSSSVGDEGQEGSQTGAAAEDGENSEELQKRGKLQHNWFEFVCRF